jgi:hypothetical protein
MRSLERLDLLREQGFPAGLGIRFWHKKPTDIELLSSDSDRPKGPWCVYSKGTRRGGMIRAPIVALENYIIIYPFSHGGNFYLGLNPFKLDCNEPP